MVTIPSRAVVFAAGWLARLWTTLAAKAHWFLALCSSLLKRQPQYILKVINLQGSREDTRERPVNSL